MNIFSRDFVFGIFICYVMFKCAKMGYFLYLFLVLNYMFMKTYDILMHSNTDLLMNRWNSNLSFNYILNILSALLEKYCRQ